MDNFHGILIFTNEAPAGEDLRRDRFGFDVIDDVADLLLKGFRFEMCFAKRTEGVHAEHDLVSILTEHECERIELAVKRTDRIDGAVTRLWFKKGTDVEIIVGFELDLCTISVCLWTEQRGVGTVCDGFFCLGCCEDGREGTVCL